MEVFTDESSKSQSIVPSRLSVALHQERASIALQVSPTVYDNIASSLIVIVGGVVSVGLTKGSRLSLFL